MIGIGLIKVKQHHTKCNCKLEDGYMGNIVCTTHDKVVEYAGQSRRPARR